MKLLWVFLTTAVWLCFSGCSSSDKDTRHLSTLPTDSTLQVKDDSNHPDNWLAEDEFEEFEDEVYKPLQALDPPTFKVNPQASPVEWQTIDQGLELAEFYAPLKSSIGDSKLTVLRIDPQAFELKLLSAKQLKQYKKPADQWATEFELAAVVNAGMFLGDQLTSNGFMVNDGYMINQDWNKTYNAVAAFNPKNDSIPLFQIIDVYCQNWAVLREQYHSLAQSIRMVDCRQENKWGKHEKFWSMVLLAEDHQHKALFIHTRSPYRVHDYINMLLSLPLNIEKLMYLEGGPETSFYLNHNSVKRELVGSYETGFNEFDDNQRFWDIPNIIGVMKKD